MLPSVSLETLATSNRKEKMHCLTKNNKAIGLKRERYDLNDNTYVFIAELGFADVVALQKKHGPEGDNADLGFAHDVLARALVNDAGERVFDSADEMKANLNISFPTLRAITEKVLEVSGL